MGRDGGRARMRTGAYLAHGGGRGKGGQWRGCGCLRLAERCAIHKVWRVCIRRGKAMNRNDILALLQHVKQGELSPDDAMRRVERETYEDLGFAKLDHQRSTRLGFPEVVYAEGKSDEHLARICEQHLKTHK